MCAAGKDPRHSPLTHRQQEGNHTGQEGGLWVDSAWSLHRNACQVLEGGGLLGSKVQGQTGEG